MKKPKGKKGFYLFLFGACQACSCTSFNSPKPLRTDDQLNESNLLWILKMNHPDNILYNELNLFTSQLSSVQTPTAYADSFTDLIEYFISPITFLPLTKRYTSPVWLIYRNKGTWYLWLPINQIWKKLLKKQSWENL